MLLLSLVWRHPLADLAAVEIGPVGAAFTAVCLATGSLWGKPMWGAWWVWDARLTSVFVLLLLYLGHIALVRAFDDPTRGYRAGAILALVGVINLPIIKFSVDWWNTLHQPASIGSDRGADDAASMLWPLLFSAIGFTLLFAAIVMTRTAGGGDGAAHPRPADGAASSARTEARDPSALHRRGLCSGRRGACIGLGLNAWLRHGAARRTAGGDRSSGRRGADDPQTPAAVDRAGLRRRAGLGHRADAEAFKDNLVFFVSPSDLAKTGPSGRRCAWAAWWSRAAWSAANASPAATLPA